MTNRHGIPVIKVKRKRAWRERICRPEVKFYEVEMPERLLMHLQDGRCFYCNQELPEDYTHDHFYPRSAGNTLYGNKVLACRSCNVQKGCRLPNKPQIEKYLKIQEEIIRRRKDK